MTARCKARAQLVPKGTIYSCWLPEGHVTERHFDGVNFYWPDEVSLPKRGGPRYRDMPRGAQVFGLFFIPLAATTIVLAVAAVVKMLVTYVFGIGS